MKAGPSSGLPPQEPALSLAFLHEGPGAEGSVFSTELGPEDLSHTHPLTTATSIPLCSGLVTHFQGSPPPAR
jgi:hypothetical protein